LFYAKIDIMLNEKIKNHSEKIKKLHLNDLFKENPARHAQFSVITENIYYDFSRQRVTQETLKLLLELANERGLKAKIEAMFAGEKINKTENRSVLHVALRSGKNPDVLAVLSKIEKFSTAVFSGIHLGVTNKKLKNIVAIGIGGSYLGPEYLAVALRPYAQKDMRLVFVANVDGTDFVEKTQGLDPEETLVVVISKTFTTAETMQNARTARQWLNEGLNNHKDSIKKHMIAVSTAKEEVEKFGIDSANMFGFWDWVGGRFSATSAVGAVPLSLYLGFDNFKLILEGAKWLDEHFKNEPIAKNIPVLCALIDIWNINFMGWKTRALLPYSQGIAKLPAHTQQVEMESNGKSVDIEGKPVGFDTGEVVFGEPGTNGQHSFYQLIHQGTQIIPCDFIGFLKPQYDLEKPAGNEVTHHEELMTNFLAQPDALSFGQKDRNLAKNFPGNRPSSCLLLEELNPFTAGLLLALTEHRAATKGFIWNINSFDQFGVQLGKVLGKDHRRRIVEFNKTGKVDAKGLNKSTSLLLESFLKQKLPQ
jgi:glucose-6-phosphate isomerase